MTIGKKMTDAINEQIREELYSSYLYFAMAADFESKDWPGVASWMKVQAQEEMAHALKFYSWIIERGGKAIFKAIDKPQESWESALTLFEAALAHEQHITQCIYDLVKIAREEGDIATEIFLQWYVTEQVEEEANASEIVEKIKKVQNSQNGMYLLDKELSARTAAPSQADSAV
jgi:ferritin